MGRGAGVGVVEPPDPRDRAGKLDDAAVVDLVEHCRTADLPGRALVYCLRPPIDYIGAGVVELKFGPGPALAGTPAFMPRDWRDNGRRYQATGCRPDRPRALYARAGRKAAFARGGGGGGAGADRLYRRQSDPRGLAGHAQARGRGLGRALSRLSRSAGQGALAHLRRDRALRRFRADPRHRLHVPLRAPHDAVLRQGPCGVPAGRARGRPVKTRPPGRRLCAPAADPGAAHLASGGHHRGRAQAARRRRADRGRAYLHVGSRRQQAGRLDRDHAVSRHVPRQPRRPDAVRDAGARRRGCGLTPARRGASLSDTSPFAPPGTSVELEEGFALTPKFDADGLVTCVATDAFSGDVLMVAHMNAEALAKTIATGEAWYFSRSRRALWKKGETSGHTQRVVELRIDCDQDAVWIKVEQIAGACHTGRRSCFYRAVPLGKAGAVALEFRAERVFDPKAAYRAKD